MLPFLKMSCGNSGSGNDFQVSAKIGDCRYVTALNCGNLHPWVELEFRREARTRRVNK